MSDVDGNRHVFVEAAAAMYPAALAREVTPLIVPPPEDLTDDVARALLAAWRSPSQSAELVRVPGAVEQLVRSLVEVGRGGRDGVAHDLAPQVIETDIGLADITSPVDLWYGTADDVCRPPSAAGAPTT